jgi:hypothetical protein
MVIFNQCVLCGSYTDCQHHHIFPKSIRKKYLSEAKDIWATDVTDKSKLREFKIKCMPINLTFAMCNKCHIKLHMAYKYSAQYTELLLLSNLKFEDITNAEKKES